MGPKTRELIGVLDELIQMLDEDEQVHWATWMRESRAQLQASSFRGVTSLLVAYGGMGSFNDVLLGPQEEDGVTWSEERIALNDKFGELQSRARELAREIEREARSSQLN